MVWKIKEWQDKGHVRLMALSWWYLHKKNKGLVVILNLIPSELLALEALVSYSIDYIMIEKSILYLQFKSFIVCCILVKYTFPMTVDCLNWLIIFVYIGYVFEAYDRESK